MSDQTVREALERLSAELAVDRDWIWRENIRRCDAREQTVLWVFGADTRMNLGLRLQDAIGEFLAGLSDGFRAAAEVELYRDYQSGRVAPLSPEDAAKYAAEAALKEQKGVIVPDVA